MNDGFTHWHTQEDEDAVEIIASIAGDDFVFIEKHPFWEKAKGKLMKKEAFEKKKTRYMRRKTLRIYTGSRIIKRNG